MASRSPTGRLQGLPGRLRRLEYLRGWSLLSRAMDLGASWSGSERNCCFLNLGGGRFADAAAACGLDFKDDGRALAAVDWDGDGDLDLWFKNRTGPQLRFLRNDLGGPSITFWLQGTRSNRDAVGARLALRCEQRSMLREVVCGDGYLSQSSRRLTFGLQAAGALRELKVRWPDGQEERLALKGLRASGLYRLKQGTGRLQRVPRVQENLPAGALPPPTPAPTNRILLRQPLPLPPDLVRAIWGAARPRRAVLLNLWAQWCQPCLTELGAWSRRTADLEHAGLDVIALNVDEPKDQEKAQQVWKRSFAPHFLGAPLQQVQLGEDQKTTLRVLLAHIFARAQGLSLPTSLLVDRDGAIQLVYEGRLETDQIVVDVQQYLDRPPLGALRSVRPGRWYFRTPRDWKTLARSLREAGRDEAARHYAALAQRRRPGR